MSGPNVRGRPGEAGERLYQQLPREGVVLSSRRGVLISVLVPLLVFLVTNLAMLWYLDHYTTNRGYWLLEQKWDMLRTMAGPTDWLVVGDSSGNQGIVPAVLQDELGETAVNLCTIGGTVALDDVWMLEEYIARLGAPPNVLFVHTYDAWYRDVQPILLAKIPLPWGYWNGYVPTPALTVEDHLNIFLGRYVPLYAENMTIGSVLMLAIQSPGSLFENHFHLEPDGYMPVMESNPQNVERDVEEHLELVRENDFALAEINRASLEQIVTLADSYHIDVFIANGPVYEGLYADEDFQEYLSDVRETLSAFAERSEYVHYLPTISVFPSSQMQNTDHLIHSAAEAYTEMLAAEIVKAR